MYQKTKSHIPNILFALGTVLTVTLASPAKVGKAGMAMEQVSSGLSGRTAAAPVVSSIVRSDSNPAFAETVEFKVTFSEPVTGVDTGDFAPVVRGINFPLVTDVRGKGSTYYVTVFTGCGSGTLGLSVIDFDLISNAAGEKLGGTGFHNGDFTDSEVYTIRRKGK